MGWEAGSLTPPLDPFPPSVSKIPEKTAISMSVITCFSYAIQVPIRHKYKHKIMTMFVFFPYASLMWHAYVTWGNGLCPVGGYLRWPDTIYLREGQLFSNQFFSCSTAFDCWDILDVEKGMLEVYQKGTFIEIDTNIRKFSAIFLNVVFKENVYYRENERCFSFILLWTGTGTSKILGTKFQINRLHNLYNKRWLK